MRHLRTASLALIPSLVFLSTTACGPLRPFEGRLTGGRAALTQWEYQEALARLYQTQVLLNLVRMVEYGETPVHFAFSDVQATITDKAGGELGLSFFDSPASMVVGNFLISPSDNPITVKPMLDASRSVQILAKTTPITGNNWIYDWYYVIATQMREKPDLRWYRNRFDSDCKDCPCLGGKENERLKKSGSDITVTYRNTVYKLKTCIVGAVKAHPCIVPPRELGALTTILTLLTESRPNYNIDLPVDPPSKPIAHEQFVLKVRIKEPAREDYKRDLLSLLKPVVEENEIVKLIIPQGPKTESLEFKVKAMLLGPTIVKDLKQKLDEIGGQLKALGLRSTLTDVVGVFSKLQEKEKPSEKTDLIRKLTEIRGQLKDKSQESTLQDAVEILEKFEKEDKPTTLKQKLDKIQDELKDNGRAWTLKDAVEELNKLGEEELAKRNAFKLKFNEVRVELVDPGDVTRLNKAVDVFLKKEEKLPAVLILPPQDKDGIPVLPSEMVDRLARRRSSPPKKTEVFWLKEIVEELQLQRSQRN